MSYQRQQARWTLGLGPRPTPPTGTDAIPQPVDLRTIPRAQWSEHEGLPVTLPPDVENYIAGMTEEMTPMEKNSIEDRVCAFHGIDGEWTVSFHEPHGCLLAPV